MRVARERQVEAPVGRQCRSIRAVQRRVDRQRRDAVCAAHQVRLRWYSGITSPTAQTAGFSFNLTLDGAGLFSSTALSPAPHRSRFL